MTAGCPVSGIRANGSGCRFGMTHPCRSVLRPYFSAAARRVGAQVIQFCDGNHVFDSCPLRLGVYSECLALPETYAIAMMTVSMSFEEAGAASLLFIERTTVTAT